MSYKKRYKHGESPRTVDGQRVYSTEYNAWSSMRARCSNINSSKWKYYGANGITYDPRWDEFANFLADMGRKPDPSFSLERINKDGNYCKANCVWASTTVQARNRAGIKLTAAKATAIRAHYDLHYTFGKDKLCTFHKELAIKYGVSQACIGDVIRGRTWRKEVDQ